jgi:hypothetical protein
MEVLAENLFWTSCEGLLQCALLAEFNRAGGRWVADRERRLAPGWQPDLLLFPSRNVGEWKWSGRAHKRESVCGLVHLKMAWTEDWSSGSASPAARRDAVEDDANKLIHMAETHANQASLFFGVLVAGVSADGADPGFPDVEHWLDRRRWRHHALPIVEGRSVQYPFLTDGGTMAERAWASLHWFRRPRR